MSYFVSCSVIVPARQESMPHRVPRKARDHSSLQPPRTGPALDLHPADLPPQISAIALGLVAWTSAMPTTGHVYRSMDDVTFYGVVTGFPMVAAHHADVLVQDAQGAGALLRALSDSDPHRLPQPSGAASVYRPSV